MTDRVHNMFMNQGCIYTYESRPRTGSVMLSSRRLGGLSTLLTRALLGKTSHGVFQLLLVCAQQLLFLLLLVVEKEGRGTLYASSDRAVNHRCSGLRAKEVGINVLCAETVPPADTPAGSCS